MKIDKDYNLRMVRGDTEEITVSLRNADGSAKALSTSDTVTLTVGKYSGGTSTAATKVFSRSAKGSSSGVALVTIQPADTNDLSFGPMVYKYDIQITFADGTVKTLFPAAWFVLEEEVSV